jgi:hypothetical protein
MSYTGIPISDGNSVSLRPGSVEARVGELVEALIAIADHDPNCRKPKRECLELCILIAKEGLARALVPNPAALFGAELTAADQEAPS